MASGQLRTAPPGAGGAWGPRSATASVASWTALTAWRPSCLGSHGLWGRQQLVPPVSATAPPARDLGRRRRRNPLPKRCIRPPRPSRLPDQPGASATIRPPPRRTSLAELRVDLTSRKSPGSAGLEFDRAGSVRLHGATRAGGGPGHQGLAEPKPTGPMRATRGQAIRYLSRSLPCQPDALPTATPNTRSARASTQAPARLPVPCRYGVYKSRLVQARGRARST